MKAFQEFYVFDVNRIHVKVPHLAHWRIWRDHPKTDTTVKSDTFGECTVRTHFVGVDHGDGLLYETNILGIPSGSRMQRYATWAEAEAGHAATVARLQASGFKDEA